MLDDLAVLEAEQVERDRRSAETFDALVSGMQQDEIAVHKRAIDHDISGRRARRFRGKRLHSGGTIGELRVMLYQRFAKIPIDGRRNLSSERCRSWPGERWRPKCRRS